MASSDADAAPDGSSASQPAPGVAARASRSAASSGRTGMMRDLDHASALVGELLGGVLVWGGIGWFVGTTWGGHPWLFIAGSMLGFAGGFYLLWLRAEGRIGSSRSSRGSPSSRSTGAPDRSGDDERARGADGSTEGS